MALNFLKLSTLMNYLIFTSTQLKFAWNYILYQSFFQSHGREFIHDFIFMEDLSLKRSSKRDEDSGESAECAICLCKIEEDDDEAQELRCDHSFHKVCLDGWIEYGHMTCPLCRSSLRRQEAEELSPGLVAVKFREALRFISLDEEDDDPCTWWLR